LLIFTFAVNYLSSTGAFPITGSSGQQITDTGTVLEETTDLATPDMGYLWIIVTTGILAGLAISYLTRSIVPGGLFIFGTVFWASFINTHGILTIGGYVPGEIMTMFTIATVFIFIGACIGMLTGSG